MGYQGMSEVDAIVEFNDGLPRKRCSFCHQPKTYDNFSRNKTTYDGYYHYCKQCQRPYQNSRNARAKNSAETAT
jgi:hypothetical protein